MERDEVYSYDTGKQKTQIVHGNLGFDLFWYQIRKDIGKKYRVAKATIKEKTYYANKVPFYMSIRDPAIIITSQKHKFLLKFIGPKQASLRLHCIEEVKPIKVNFKKKVQ